MRGKDGGRERKGERETGMETERKGERGRDGGRKRKGEREAGREAERQRERESGRAECGERV